MKLTYRNSHILGHAGSCNLLGITSAGILYVEVIDSNNWVIQYRIDESTQQVADEQAGDTLFMLPDDLIEPRDAEKAVLLNHIGPRYRGMREPERIADMVQPLTVMQKMPLIQHFDLKIPPMLLLGMGESRVLSEAVLSESEVIVCRRVRLVYALPEVHYDADGLPYDYDSIAVQIVHLYNPLTDEYPSIEQTIADFQGVRLWQPTTCLVHADCLYLADSGQQNSQIHCWQIEP